MEGNRNILWKTMDILWKFGSETSEYLLWKRLDLFNGHSVEAWEGKHYPERALAIASSNILEPDAEAVCTSGMHPGLRIPWSGSIRAFLKPSSITDFPVIFRVSVHVSFCVNFWDAFM